MYLRAAHTMSGASDTDQEECLWPRNASAR
jgi:hypothetical protein